MKMKTTYLIALGMIIAGIGVQAEEHKGHDHAAEGQTGKSAPHVEQAFQPAHGGHDEHEERAIKLSPEVLEEFGIELATAAPGTVAVETVLPGEIQINQDRLAHVIPRYPGVVLEVKKNIGDPVKKGDVVAVLEGNDSLTPYPLRAMIDGVVIDKHITMGESLQTDRDVYAIADLSDVWVSITLYQKDLAMVEKGQSVTISGGVHLAPSQGKIDYVSPTLDERTRTGYARVVLPNPDGRWKPGMFITAQVEVANEAAAIVIPQTALQTLEAGVSVFVETDEGFEPRAVELGRANRTQMEILSGLKAGERYVAKGAFTLKAELGRGEMDEGHSH